MEELRIRHLKCPDCGGETFSSFTLPKDTKWFKCLKCGALLRIRRSQEQKEKKPSDITSYTMKRMLGLM